MRILKWISENIRKDKDNYLKIWVKKKIMESHISWLDHIQKRLINVLGVRVI